MHANGSFFGALKLHVVVLAAQRFKFLLCHRWVKHQHTRQGFRVNPEQRSHTMILPPFDRVSCARQRKPWAQPYAQLISRASPCVGASACQLRCESACRSVTRSGNPRRTGRPPSSERSQKRSEMVLVNTAGRECSKDEESVSGHRHSAGPSPS